MKKIFIILLLTTLSLNSKAQEEPKFVYCEIVGTSQLFSTKVTIVIDYGQRMKWFEDNRAKDASGNKIVFNSMIDALNYMGKDGWEFAQAYAITMGQQNVYHYLMKKPFIELNKEQQSEFLK
jgi:hypothetical protein